MPEIDARWITEALQRALGTGAIVVEVSGTSIGTGQVGENVRFELTWGPGGAPELPRSVVAKLPSTSEISRATAVQLDTYTKEVGFYRDLQRHVAIRTPRIHALEWDADSHDFVLLMEDIRPAEQGDQLGGCGLARAELAVDQAVGLHAPTWGRVHTLGAPWLQVPGDGADVALRSQMFELLTPGFVERYRGRLGHDDLMLTTELTGRYPQWHGELKIWGAANGWCVVHGDYRLDNLLFGQPPSSPAVTVVDWQTVAVGAGPVDIAYFCGAGLLPDDRRRHERDLVERYAGGLRSAGVEIGTDDVWDAYVLGSVSGLYMSVLASQIVERTERGDEMFAVMAERHLDQVRTVGLLDRLGAD